MPKDRPRERDLLVDVYRPVAGGKPLANRPAVIMAFGGAFHRGDKGEEHFTEDGAQDSSMADYCRRFARDGYACFSRSEARSVGKEWVSTCSSWGLPGHIKHKKQETPRRDNKVYT